MASATSTGPERTAAPSVRQQLVRGGVGHVREHGVENLTVRTLAAAAGRSTMCVYSKFGGRDALVAAIFEEAAGTLLDALSTASARDFLESLRTWATGNQGLWDLLLQRSDVPGVPATARSELLCALQQRFTVTLPEPAEPAQSVLHLATATGLLTVDRHTGPGGCSPQLLEEAWGLLLEAVAG